ncbi:hypothetical protein [uncultured Holdemania sp.]|uniref:hypothetical protein n=1 Tax=uncultured Holdemania sp. TaxID=527664 RepID=UPI0028065A4A|nr:hypothetical protein [uncultured Holdemania sp.]
MIGRKVFDLNGSPHVKNRTCTTPQEIEKLFHQEGLQTISQLLCSMRDLLPCLKSGRTQLPMLGKDRPIVIHFIGHLP